MLREKVSCSKPELREAWKEKKTKNGVGVCQGVEVSRRGNMSAVAEGDVTRCRDL